MLCRGHKTSKIFPPETEIWVRLFGGIDRQFWHLKSWIEQLSVEKRLCPTTHQTNELFHNSCLFRRIQQNRLYKNWQTWSRIEPMSLATLTITLESFLCLCEIVNGFWFMYGCIYLICPIHLIRRKLLYFEKTGLKRKLGIIQNSIQILTPVSSQKDLPVCLFFNLNWIDLWLRRFMRWSLELSVRLMSGMALRM